MKIDIIGAGIGGLTLAIGLKRHGYEYNVYEQAAIIKPVGAGIILANNATKVYRQLGILDRIQAAGNTINAMNLTNRQLKPMTSIDLAYFQQKFNCPTVALHRGVLQQILLEEVDRKFIHTGHRLICIEEQSNGNILHFEGQEKVRSRIIIGADGIHSAVRMELFPKAEIRYADQLCWRGVADFSLPKKYHEELNEAWGRGERFGFVQIGPNKVYWYALKSFNKNSEELSIVHLPEYFKDYHPIIREIIASTKVDQIHISTISDLKSLPMWYKDGICLLGDAAHAITPNMGQGACQAIEDAHVLTHCLTTHPPHEAFALYHKLRKPKVDRLFQLSWKTGKMAHWKNPFAIFLRNNLMRMTPTRLQRKQSEAIFQLREV